MFQIAIVYEACKNGLRVFLNDEKKILYSFLGISNEIYEKSPTTSNERILGKFRYAKNDCSSTRELTTRIWMKGENNFIQKFSVLQNLGYWSEKNSELILRT